MDTKIQPEFEIQEMHISPGSRTVDQQYVPIQILKLTYHVSYALIFMFCGFGNGTMFPTLSAWLHFGATINVMKHWCCFGFTVEYLLITDDLCSVSFVASL